jgi:pilus assembly protein FimV
MGSSSAAGSGPSGTNAAGGSAATHTAAAEVSGATAALDRITSVLANNILFVIAGVLALCAFVIAWMMRRAGSRRDDENEDIDAASDPGPAATAAFEQKMQSIDLNLDDAPAANKTVAPAPKA